MRIQPVNGDVGVCPRHVCHFISAPFNIEMPLRAISWGLILKPKRPKEVGRLHRTLRCFKTPVCHLTSQYFSTGGLIGFDPSPEVKGSQT